MSDDKAVVEVGGRANAMQALADRLQVSKDVLMKTLKETAFRECKTNEEFVAAVIVANAYGLNPLLGEIYAFPGKKGGVCPVVPIDGWIKLMNRHMDADGKYDHDGIELVENRGGKANASKTDVDSITAKIYTKGKTHPTVVTEYMAECFNGSKQPWTQWPIRMLRHKALIQCARIAYGFSGIYDQDEAERIRESGGAERNGKPAIAMPKALSEAASAVAPEPEPEQEAPQNMPLKAELSDILLSANEKQVEWYSRYMGELGLTAVGELNGDQLRAVIAVLSKKAKK